MSRKNIAHVEEMNDGEKMCSLKSPLKKVTNWIVKNPVINEIDFFSLNLKFLLKGEENFRTVYAGLIGIMMYATLALITYYVAWPHELTSEISQNIYSETTSSIGQSIFSDIQTPINIKLVNNGNLSIPSEFQIKFYEVRSDNSVKELPSSVECPDEGLFCLKSSDFSAEIYGNYQKKQFDWSKIRIQGFWCNATQTQCFAFPIAAFGLIIQLKNTKPEKSVQLTQFLSTVSINSLSMLPSTYKFTASRESYTSNNMFFGHLSNIFPQTLHFYKYQTSYKLQNEIDPCSDQNMETQYLAFAIEFIPSGMIFIHEQQFTDITAAIIFFFALMDPVRAVINYLLVRSYNRNSRDLYIANQLFYIEGNNKKYDFDSGSAVFFTCLFYRHFIFYFVKKMFLLCGKNFADVLPKKCVYTISMINLGQSLLHQNNFFGTLEELSNLDDCPAKKIPFCVDQTEQDEKKQSVEIQQLQYFSDDSVKRQAFAKFCESNEIFTTDRKNNIYEILQDTQYTTTLKDLLHKEFNVHIRHISNKYHQQEELKQIEVQLLEEKINYKKSMSEKFSESAIEESAIQFHKNKIKE